MFFNVIKINWVENQWNQDENQKNPNEDIKNENTWLNQKIEKTIW